MTQVNPMPGKPVREKVAVYIDGFNLYFGIRDSGLGRYLWLDLCALAANLKHPNQDLVAVKYFTARVSRPEAKRKRQNTYLEALGSLDPNLFSISYGNFQQNPSRCSRCGEVSDVPSEKQTDVNIAVAVLTDAHRDVFDVAFLISADSDLCPVVSSVRNLFPKKRVISMFPPGRGSKELAQASSGCFNIGRVKLSQSQFPNEITLASGYTLKKPELWETEEYHSFHTAKG
jgi:uncharacterized LabA/DUF88 family protein